MTLVILPFFANLLRTSLSYKNSYENSYKIKRTIKLLKKKDENAIKWYKKISYVQVKTIIFKIYKIN